MGSTVAQKLKIKEGQVLLAINAPNGFSQQLGDLPSGAKVTSVAKAPDQIHWFVRNRAEMAQQFDKVRSLVSGAVMCWVYYPKGSSGLQTDLTRDTGWDIIMAHDMQWLSLISFDETWSAFGFREKTAADRKKVDRPKEQPVLEWVDSKTREVRLPDDMDHALRAVPHLRQYFNSLAFSHKREYIEWIVSAKKQQTREQRIKGMLERLEKGWKNPANR